MWDGRRRERSVPRRRFREAGLGGDPLAFDGAVDGGASETEELGDF
jgi:hypothetical protein